MTDIDKKDYDLIIVVFGCDSIDKYKRQVLKIQETYEKTINNYDNVKILYFMGEKHSNQLENENIIHIDNLKDTYYSASYKQWFGLNYVYKYYNTKFVMCFGTDTFINVPKLLNFLNDFNPDENLYIGGHGCHRRLNNKRTYYHSGGPGFILSKCCLHKLYNKISNVEECLKEWTNICETSRNGGLITACDVAMGYFAQTQEINSKIIKVEKGFYHCNYNGNPCCQNKFKPSEIISCHKMSLKNFEEFNEMLLNNMFYI